MFYLNTIKQLFLFVEQLDPKVVNWPQTDSRKGFGPPKNHRHQSKNIKFGANFGLRPEKGPFSHPKTPAGAMIGPNLRKLQKQIPQDSLYCYSRLLSGYQYWRFPKFKVEFK